MKIYNIKKTVKDATAAGKSLTVLELCELYEANAHRMFADAVAMAARTGNTKAYDAAREIRCGVKVIRNFYTAKNGTKITDEERQNIIDVLKVIESNHELMVDYLT